MTFRVVVAQAFWWGKCAARWGAPLAGVRRSLMKHVSNIYISFSIGFAHVLLLRHYALSLRRRVGGEKWPTRLGGRLAWETRYIK